MTGRASSEGVGPRLAAARRQRGLVQVAVARGAGIAPSYLSRIENGKVQPTFRTVMIVARVLGASLAELVEPEPPARRPPRACPVTESGRCLLDLLGDRLAPDHFSTRQVRLLRRFATWINDVPANRLRAMEILLDDLIGGPASSS